MIIVLTLINVALCGLSVWCLYMTASLSKEALRLARNRVIEAGSDHSGPSGYQDLSAGPRYREYGDLS